MHCTLFLLLGTDKTAVFSSLALAQKAGSGGSSSSSAPVQTAVQTEASVLKAAASAASAAVGTSLESNLTSAGQFRTAMLVWRVNRSAIPGNM